jgi:hypothetical protein
VVLANTGASTQLRVEVVWGGAARATTVVAPGAPFTWRSITATPPNQQALDDLRLRFTTLGGGDSNVRAAYFQLMTTPASGSATVSVVGSAAKIRPNEQPSGATGASLVAARNEFESFQVVVRAGTAAIDGLVVEHGSALTGPGGTIANSNVTIYREAYYNAAQPSDGAEGATGRWPDALIPSRDTFFGQARNAFPVDIPAGENRVAWVDVRVPSNAAGGVYNGSLQVTASGGLTTTVPIQLRVLNFSIPETSSVRSAFRLLWNAPCMALYGNDCINDPDPARGWRTFAMFTRAALDNRVTISSTYQPVGSAGNTANFTTYQLPMLKGTASTAPSPPDLTPRLPGARLTSIEADLGHLSAWRTVATSQGFADRVFFYACDEPLNDPAKWAACKQRATNARAIWPEVPVLITATITKADQFQATGLIDILVPLVNFMHDKSGGDPVYQGSQRAKYDAFLNSPGNELWMYNSCMSAGCGAAGEPDEYWRGWPGYLIDAPASESRAMGWLTFLYRTSGELYYETGGKLQTAWTDQFDFGGNGDGTLFYPGTPDRIGGTQPIPIESIRLKLIRDGYEDYEYLKFLSEHEMDNEVRSTAAGLFPATFETSRTDAQIQTARKQLADHIAAIVQSERRGRQRTQRSPLPA